MKTLVCIHDKPSNLYGDVLCYDNFETAYAMTRRYVRDKYIEEEATLDSIKESELVEIGRYDERSGIVESIVDDKRRIVCFLRCIEDLLDDEGRSIKELLEDEKEE